MNPKPYRLKGEVLEVFGHTMARVDANLVISELQVRVISDS